VAAAQTSRQKRQNGSKRLSHCALGAPKTLAARWDVPGPSSRPHFLSSSVLLFFSARLFASSQPACKLADGPPSQWSVASRAGRRENNNLDTLVSRRARSLAPLSWRLATNWPSWRARVRGVNMARAKIDCLAGKL